MSNSIIFAVKHSSAMKLNENTLKKLEELFKQLQYKVRYEKGHFQSGYCLVKNQKVIVINKFFTTEARINCLIEIIQLTEIEEIQKTAMDEISRKLLDEVLKEPKPTHSK
jgi:phage anti-repressor protein